MKGKGLVLYTLAVVAVCAVIGAALFQRRKASDAEEARKNPPPQIVRMPAPQPGQLPPGVTLPPGAMPPGAMPPGAMPPGAMPPGVMPPGGMQPLLPSSAQPPLLPPMSQNPGALRPPQIRTDVPARPPFSGGVHTEPVIDLNSAPVSALVKLPGITPEYAKLIVAHRPYRDRTDLEKAGLPHDVVEKLGPPAMIRSVETTPKKNP
jgi:hypothetical protein